MTVFADLALARRLERAEAEASRVAIFEDLYGNRWDLIEGY